MRYGHLVGLLAAELGQSLYKNYNDVPRHPAEKGGAANSSDLGQAMLYYQVRWCGEVWLYGVRGCVWLCAHHGGAVPSL